MTREEVVEVGGEMTSRTGAFAALAAAALSACAIVDQYGERAVSYNRETRQSQDAGLLLNIIRSQHRHPLQFTAVTGITGNNQAQAQVGLLLPFGIDASRIYTASPGGSANGSTQFQVVVLDTQEFIQGILRPIDLPTLDYYLQQQYPKDVLYHLLFERVEVLGADGTVRLTYDNNPKDGKKFEAFQGLVANFYNSGLTTETITETKDIGPPLSAADLRNPEQLVKIEEAGMTLHSLNANRTVFQLQKETKRARFCYRGHPPHGSQPASNVSDNTTNEAARCGAHRQASADTGPSKAARSRSAGFSAPGLQPGEFYVFYPRSTEGVIYYLGEIVRQQFAEPPTTAKVWSKTGKQDMPLFLVHKGSVPDALVSVSYLGQTYSVAANTRGEASERTTQIMELVSQLLSLNKSAKDLPTTNVFTLLGR